MDSLLYTATSGASRVLSAQQVRSNNLSNADTTGFRADMERAKSYAIQGRGFDGSTMVVTNSASTRFDAGDMVKTGRKLDIAINGDGFLTVQSPDGGESYTRAGNLKIDQQGNLTVNGFPVMAEGEPIVIPPNQSIEISETGMVTVIPPGGGAELEVGQLKLVNPNIADVQKMNDGLLQARDGNDFAADATVRLAPEHLEGSNVSAIEELVSVMSLTRNFEMQVRMMKTAEKLAQAGNRLLRNG
ncbi:flagellar basal-body rod protein FlgF [Photobacterium sp. WH77]|uniref:Flagellar basal-body rod protein FlgF n=1 Tax=Photobacterium arenosum TaxID=2774143 RepID=A0ABR9BMQ0_9GAMM|nr:MULTISPECIES: flagellar basal-body rod protein FlgF [Photobacterium]MBD8513839.1 flagellar basal-body rod protein FlgF [Photobacterium arenosum]MBV7262520.1 flagellar basal-body rod protein FlgF [Photobacterium sp. WH24]MCG2836410.1 flagellar basal-body rod protein FlgF [Photobacterium sp. WH77]MCG2843963.1 flagellar basal-body rod protein FlgF [Photobacterium sp. WH80]MDO6583447.1 flagellar basal-body rod protein FlgF [Photobacterium sp. 2_MG-2023]